MTNLFTIRNSVDVVIRLYSGDKHFARVQTVGSLQD